MAKTPYKLNKFIAHTGLCSRRKAADLVKEGSITVNGKVEINPATEVSESDEVMYKGKVLKVVKKYTYLLLNKPKNVLSTMLDKRGRKTVWDLAQTITQERVYPVGRLDRNTTGLLIMTNDGDLARKLSHPSSNVTKSYVVTCDKTITKAHMVELFDGVELEDGQMKVDRIDYLPNEPRTKVSVDIHSGRNRIVRRIFQHLGYEVVRLDRIYYAGLTKGGLPKGHIRHLKPHELRMLKHFS